MAKKDIRIIKTQRALVSAMLLLLEKQDFSAITVNDLCTEAMVSRSTFYVYFEDKYALLHFCMETINQRLFLEQPNITLAQRLTGLLEGVKANVRVFKNLMMVNQDAELYEMIRKSLQEDMERLLETPKTAQGVVAGPLDIVSTFYAAGMTSAITMWVAKNMPYTVNEMVDCLLRLVPGQAVDTAE